MRLGIASGKGGTGKTLVATNLARVMGERCLVQYVDCDVEEPNGSIFLRPLIAQSTDVSAGVPSIDKTLCTRCGRCSSFCRFGALAVMSNGVIVFPELCHSCGGCQLVCPSGALSMRDRTVGAVQSGSAGGVRFVEGRLNVGEPMAPPVIRAALDAAGAEALVIVDSPPGTSCSVIAAIRSCDYVLLVVEPTPFGMHDFRLALETLQALGLRGGAVINREGLGDMDVDAVCRAASIPILGRIPFDRRIAEVYARGEMVVDSLPDVRTVFEALADGVEREASCSRS